MILLFDQLRRRPAPIAMTPVWWRHPVRYARWLHWRLSRAGQQERERRFLARETMRHLSRTRFSRYFADHMEGVVFETLSGTKH